LSNSPPHIGQLRSSTPVGRRLIGAFQVRELSSRMMRAGDTAAAHVVPRGDARRALLARRASKRLRRRCPRRLYTARRRPITIR
jgi:hypothetical protein